MKSTTKTPNATSHGLQAVRSFGLEPTTTSDLSGRLRIGVCVCPAVALLCTGAGTPRTGVLNVPSDYPTIQAAIDAAQPGDEVVIADGVYNGPGNRDLDFAGAGITS